MSSIPDSRGYIHDRCEQTTEVSGSAFSNLASPLAGLKQTYCNACKGMFPVAEFRWADTDEPLPKYYKRHEEKATELDRFIASKNSILAGLVAAVVIGVLVCVFFLVIQGDGVASAVACGIGATVLSLIAIAAILVSVLTPMVHKRVCGVADPRELV